MAVPKKSKKSPLKRWFPRILSADQFIFYTLIALLVLSTNATAAWMQRASSTPAQAPCPGAEQRPCEKFGELRFSDSGARCLVDYTLAQKLDTIKETIKNHVAAKIDNSCKKVESPSLGEISNLCFSQFKITDIDIEPVPFYCKEKSCTTGIYVKRIQAETVLSASDELTARARKEGSLFSTANFLSSAVHIFSGINPFQQRTAQTEELERNIARVNCEQNGIYHAPPRKPQFINCEKVKIDIYTANTKPVESIEDFLQREERMQNGTIGGLLNTVALQETPIEGGAGALVSVSFTQGGPLERAAKPNVNLFGMSTVKFNILPTEQPGLRMEHLLAGIAQTPPLFEERTFAAANSPVEQAKDIHQQIQNKSDVSKNFVAMYLRNSSLQGLLSEAEQKDISKQIERAIQQSIRDNAKILSSYTSFAHPDPAALLQWGDTSKTKNSTLDLTLVYATGAAQFASLGTQAFLPKSLPWQSNCVAVPTPTDIPNLKGDFATVVSAKGANETLQKIMEHTRGEIQIPSCIDTSCRNRINVYLSANPVIQQSPRGNAWRLSTNLRIGNDLFLSKVEIDFQVSKCAGSNHKLCPKNVNVTANSNVPRDSPHLFLRVVEGLFEKLNNENPYRPTKMLNSQIQDQIQQKLSQLEQTGVAIPEGAEIVGCHHNPSTGNLHCHLNLPFCRY